LPGEGRSRGVTAFVELPACHDDMSGEQDTAVLSRVRGTVRALEAEARDARSTAERVKIYGALLPTCATCHAGGC
jgi:hypothetical protein